jgi:hypothetical protein
MTGILSPTDRQLEMRMPLWVASAAKSALKDYVAALKRDLQTSTTADHRDVRLVIVTEFERALAEYERAYNTARLV